MSLHISKTLMQGVVDQKPACTEVEPELFFPLYNQGGDGQFNEARAKQVCRGCPLLYTCLEFALETEDQWAILGGTTPAERNVILRKRSERQQRKAA